jgi:hypothetical protein
MAMGSGRPHTRAERVGLIGASMGLLALLGAMIWIFAPVDAMRDPSVRREALATTGGFVVVVAAIGLVLWIVTRLGEHPNRRRLGGNTVAIAAAGGGVLAFLAQSELDALDRLGLTSSGVLGLSCTRLPSPALS